MSLPHSRRPLLTAAVVAVSAALLLAGLTACTSSQTAQTGSPATAGSTQSTTPDHASVTVPDQTPAPTNGPADASSTTSAPTSSASTPPPQTVSAYPALGSTDLSPIAPISITAGGGTLTGVTMTGPNGAVTGSLSADGRTWTVGESLGYDRTYTVTGTATGADGQTVPIEGTYTTLDPKDQVTTSIYPKDGMEVGIAQPVEVMFGYKVADPAAVIAAMKITTTPAVEGACAWVQHDGQTYPSLDWRPKDYWPAGTKVHVESNIYGVAFANGLYGGDSKTSDFTIGRSQVVYADATTYSITVRQGCTTMNDPDSCTSTVATYPASYGMGDDPDSRYGLKSQFVTRSGIHVVMGKSETVSMSNPGYYENVIEHWAVLMSDNGEYIHANPGTVGDQGNTNVSHGCINLSTANGKAYYDSAMIGDPVEVTGTSVPLSKADGDTYDWTIPWATWTTMTTPASISS